MKTQAQVRFDNGEHDARARAKGDHTAGHRGNVAEVALYQGRTSGLGAMGKRKLRAWRKETLIDGVHGSRRLYLVVRCR